MSSVEVDLRPPRPWRIVILIAAVACLGLTMCVRSEQKRAPARPSVQNTAQPQAPTESPQQAQKPAPPPPPRPDYFPATKAPGGMYR
jgi:hypothetical protein